MADRYDAIVLCGGAARRLGGADKPGLVVGGRSLLDGVLAAVSGAGQVIGVGPSRPTARSVRWCREDPPGGGPVAALAAALPLVEARLVALLAVDLPFLTADVVDQLVAAVVDDGALLLDDAGREQWLVGCWRTEVLREAVGVRTGGRLAEVLSPLSVVRLTLPGTPWQDCDTEDDLEKARASRAGDLG